MKKLTKILLVMTVATLNNVDAQTSGNPLLGEWNTPYQTPPFSSIQNRHYKPAVKTAIDIAEKNIARIERNQEPPTFDNTVVALEDASELLERVCNVMFNINECNTDAELQSIVMELSPELSRFENKVSMNKKLFERVKAVYDQRASLGLTKEQTMLLDKCYKRFVRNGVGLPAKEQKKFAKNAEELSKLTQQFNQHVLADNNEYTLHLTNENDLKGLPASAVNAAREEAAKRKMDGWVFTLAYPSYGPFITYCDNRALREEMWRAYNSRGNRANANNNNALIARITALRMQQAQLLGYDTYADYVLADRMAATRITLGNFMLRMISAAAPAAKSDMAELERYVCTLAPDLQLQRWDIAYYAEKLKQSKYAFDAEELRPYFQLERVENGIFDLYGHLYGLKFVPDSQVEVYHSDVKVYQVCDGNKVIGLLYLDMFPRASKRSGAWMTEFRAQSRLNGKEQLPLILVVCNFTKPVGDTPSLLTFDEVKTFMHEMGHAIHGMLSDVTYPSVSGTNVQRDFVELPSQLMENWCYEPAFLNTFARHYKTNATLPAEYIEKIRRSENFMAGYYCIRQLSLGSVDIAFHSLTQPMTESVEAFERKNMMELLPAVEGCCTSTSFTHIFAGGYAAGYYGYKWAEVLDADVYSRFKERGVFDKKTATEFRQKVLSKGGSEPAADLFRAFMGREPNEEALLIRCGFIEPLQAPQGLEQIK